MFISISTPGREITRQILLTYTAKVVCKVAWRVGVGAHT
jgi:hypothetical protein